MDKHSLIFLLVLALDLLEIFLERKGNSPPRGIDKRKGKERKQRDKSDDDSIAIIVNQQQHQRNHNKAETPLIPKSFTDLQGLV